MDLDGLDLYTDPNGLPIHGTLSAQASWDVHAVETSGRVSRLRAGFEYTGGELLAAFPFPTGWRQRSRSTADRSR